jgi:hypothetical protein
MLRPSFIVHHADIIAIEGESYRRRDAERAHSKRRPAAAR